MRSGARRLRVRRRDAVLRHPRQHDAVEDGIRPSGLKRPARGRVIPLHPELLRLGLPDYVEAMAAAGHTTIFPELYQPGMANIGGKRFYACAGRYLLDHVDTIEPLLRTSKGKRADAMVGRMAD